MYEAQKEIVFLAMMTVNILKVYVFMFLTACTFGFGELKLMEGSAKIISYCKR